MTGVIGRGFVGLLALSFVVTAGCGESDLSEGSEPIRAPGTVSAPHRPVIVQPLPSGWSVSGVELPTYVMGRREMQTLYLPPGSTPERGPALAVGSFGQDDGYTLCSGGQPLITPGVTLRGSYPAAMWMARSGPLVMIEGEVSTDEPGYVFGRGVTNDEIRAAARAAQFPADGVAEIARDGLPPSFRRFASAPVIPNGTFGEVIELKRADGAQFVRIGAYDGDEASDALTRFWNATVMKEPCGGDSFAKLAHSVQGTDVNLRGQVSKAMMDQIAGSLAATDQSGLDAFRAKVGDISASTLLVGCLLGGPDGSVILDGTERGVRWALAMSTDAAHASSCTAFVIDGRIEPGLSSSGGPAPAGEGSHDVALLASSNSAGDAPGGALHVVGGTVPASTTRVVISDGSGATVDATLVHAGLDPTVAYFGGLLYPSAAGSAGLVATVLAFDRRGREIGRYGSPRN